MTFVFTTVVVCGVLAMVLAAGVAVTRTLGWSRAFSRDDWFDAPFLGMALIVLVLENLVYWGVTLQRSTRPFMAALALGLGVLAWRGRLAGAWRSCPAAVFAVAAIVYVVHGVGLWINGVDQYLGRGWTDQINYVALAQYLIDVPFGQALQATQPAELFASRHAWVRIGQSVLHGFSAVGFGLEAKSLFEPIILLCPALIAIAFYGLSRRARLTRPLALLIAAAAASLPALTAIHIECFLSHALALPGLYYLVVLLDRASERGDWRDYVKAALVCASTTAIYLELLPLLLLIVVTFGVVGALGAPNRWRHLLWTGVIGAAPFLLRATQGLDFVLSYSGLPVLQGLYPWAFRLEGFERLWAGDLVGRAFAADRLLVQALSVGLVMLGGLGLLMQVWGEAFAFDDRGARRWTGVARGLAMLGIATVPWAIVVRSADNPYQFYKLLMSAAPLLVFGCGYAAWLSLRRVAEATRANAVVSLVAPIGLLAAIATADMTVAAARPDLPVQDPRYQRQSAHKHLDPAFLQVWELLRTPSPSRTVYQCVVDGTHVPFHIGAWFAIAARQHQVWSLTAGMNDADLPGLAGAHYYDWTPGVTPTPLFVTSRLRGALWVTPSEQFSAREIGDYRLVQPGSDPVVLACAPGLELTGGSTAIARLGADRFDFNLFSSARREATVNFRSEPIDGRNVPLALTAAGAAVPLTMDAAGFHSGQFELRSGVTHLTLATTAPVGGRAVASSLAFGVIPARMVLTSIANPNGLDFGLEKRFFWMGGGVTTLTIYAVEGGVCAIDALANPGPSVTTSAVRRVRVGSTAGDPFDFVTGVGPLTIRVPVAPGWNRVTLEPLDRPDTILPSDTRPLVLSLQISRVALEPGADAGGARRPTRSARPRGTPASGLERR